MNYEILISISLGDNFPLQDEFLSKDCKTSAILEARFNDEVLQSDPIEINSVNPELATELGFRVNKKDFHQFRIERKSIKLQCFVEYSVLTERHFIGYVILHLRDAQEYSHNPKNKWIVLLNPKYKGASVKRPQLYLAFMVNKLKDDDLCNSTLSSSMSESQISSYDSSIESHFTRPLKRENDSLMSRSVNFGSKYAFDDYDSNLKVKHLHNRCLIWDSNKCSENELDQNFVIKIRIDKPKNLLNLLSDKSCANSKEDSIFYFRYTLLNKQFRTPDFVDITDCSDFNKNRFSFNIITFDKDMLKQYFESYPTIEIQLCHGFKVIGFVTINLLRLFENNLNLEGDYMIVPEDESVYVKEPFPIVKLSMTVSKVDQPESKKKEIETLPKYSNVDPSMSENTSINHYYIAIDLRTIKLSNTENCQILFQPFYLQFSYAFFGITDYIKTYPPICFSPDNPQAGITIPHGFCGFNFTTLPDKLFYTFTNIPFMVQLMLEKDNTLLGTAELDLSCLLRKRSKSKEQIGDNFVNRHVFVLDNDLNEKICEIQIVMFLQEIIMDRSSNDPDEEFDRQMLAPTANADLLSMMIVDTAHDIELWKEEQMKMFKCRLKQKEDKLRDRESEIEARQKELDQRFEKLNLEIDEAIHEVRSQYEEKAIAQRNHIKSLEQEKYKCQERIYQLEHSLRSKDLKIKELESKMQIASQKERQRANSLTRNTYAPANSRKIIITRESQSTMSKSMFEDKTSESLRHEARDSSALKPPSVKQRFKVPVTSAIKPPTTQTDILSIDRIRKERQDLIKKGVSLKDPLITEIDKRIKNHRLCNTKRI